MTQDGTPSRQLYSAVPIPPNSRCIRLLDLVNEASTSKSSPLTASLRVADLNTSPDFISLSYEWHPSLQVEENDDPRLWPVIFCTAEAAAGAVTRDGRNANVQVPIRITRNCHSALSHIRQRFQAPRTIAIWVDAICINQQDGREKEHQIPLMCDIYSRAICVYAWLGDGDDETDRAMTRLKRLGRLAERLPVETLKVMSRHGDEYDMEASKEAIEKHRRRVWLDVLVRLLWSPTWAPRVDLDVVLARTWVFRSWTLQETILAQDLIFMCGHQTVSWHDMVSALFCPPQGQFFTIPHPIRRETLAHWQPIFTLWLQMPRGRLHDGTRGTFHHAAGRAAQEVTAITRELWLFFILTSIFLCAVLLGAYLLITTSIRRYMEWTNSEMLKPWTFPTIAYISISMNLVLLWKKIVLGLEQTWIQTNNSASPASSSKIDRLAILEAIRRALTTRDCVDLHDKCISLYGILDTCGIEHPSPNYNVSVGETYQRFVEHLIYQWDSCALLLLLDCGERGRRDATPLNVPDWPTPSWVPNWTLGAGPSAWLTSQYPSGLLKRFISPQESRATFPRQLARDLLILEGTSLGKITYHATVSPTPDGSGQGRSAGSNIATLASYIAHAYRAIRMSGRVEMSRNPESAIFAIFEGLIRHSKSTYKETTGPMGSSQMHRAPIWEAPYDFRNEKKIFSKFRSVCRWVISQPNIWIAEESDREEGEISPATVASEISDGIESDSLGTKVNKVDDEDQPLRTLSTSYQPTPPGLPYLEGVSQKLLTQERGLFVVSSSYYGDHLGSGPLRTEVGDEVFHLKYVPCPMVLRRVAGPQIEGLGGSTGSDKWKIIGAALIEDQMRMPLYTNKFREVVIC